MSRWSSSSKGFGKEEEEKSKTLGLMWLPQSDQLSYDINIVKISRVNKRAILSEISRIFDPLGLLSPCVVVTKMIIQELWLLKLSWDEAIPLQLHTKWIDFRSELHTLNELNIDRHVICRNPIRIELHGFSDASERAYGGCIYLRSVDGYGNVYVRLLYAKAKVSPVKPTTIPRLELCGALILSRLYQKVVQSLNVRFDHCQFWSDSTIVLAWLKIEPSKLKTFVCNRVSEIQTNTHPYSWRHISGSNNPADLLSRGTSPSNLKNSSMWWQGPEWLQEQNYDKDFVSNERCLQDDSDLPDLKVIKQCLITRKGEEPFSFKNYSCWNKLRRVTAYCLRFCTNCKLKANDRTYGSLTTKELNALILVKRAQLESFREDINSIDAQGTIKQRSKLLKLTPFCILIEP
ncbi:uncharacterized protein LOC111692526 [Anoplophora glabripennis]|uniref:uncharacterized protein LOC111692526 n=1 Tax=Anoplophora glabripennis TaxID=217634 RepID=UPI000C7895C9|nr:uncharacterized protein LOC111692526 [Anoplophora glabripennis]